LVIISFTRCFIVSSRLHWILYWTGACLPGRWGFCFQASLFLKGLSEKQFFLSPLHFSVLFFSFINSDSSITGLDISLLIQIVCFAIKGVMKSQRIRTLKISFIIWLSIKYLIIQKTLFSY
jgi:hypothetical protein